MLTVRTTDIDRYLASPLEFWVNMKGKSKVSVQSCLNVSKRNERKKSMFLEKLTVL